MFIRTNYWAINTTNSLRKTNDKIQKTLEKLSSGFRINRAAYDAAGLAISEKLRYQIDGLNQASRNIQDGISLVQTAEGAMQEIHSMLQRMNQLAVQAANGTYTDDDRAQLQLELQQLVTEIDNIAEKTEFNGIKILNGDHSLKSENSYSQIIGSRVLNGSVTVDSTNNTLNFELDYDTYTITLNSDNYTPEQLVESINTRLADQNVPLMASLVNGKISFRHLDSGDNPIYQISGNGISLLLNHQQGTPSQYVVAGEALLSPFITITAGVNDELTFEVDGTSYSITLSPGTYVTPLHANPETSPLAMEINQKISQLGIAVTAGYGGFAGTHPSIPGDVYSACLTFKGPVSYIGNFGGSAKDTLLGNLWVDQLKSGQPSIIRGSSDLSNGLEIISGVNDTLVINVNGITKTYTFSPGSYSASELVQELNDKLNADNMAVSILDGNLNLAQNDGLSMNLLGGNLSRDLFFSYSEGTADEDTDNKGISIQKGITADDTLVLDMPNCTGTELGMPGLNISTAETASNAIQSIKNAITKTSAYRARMGAYQNRLEHTLSNVQNYAENLTASESRIRNADIAKEMTELIKNRIIAEAGIAVLAQANALPQSILKLLM